MSVWSFKKHKLNLCIIFALWKMLADFKQIYELNKNIQAEIGMIKYFLQFLFNSKLEEKFNKL